MRCEICKWIKKVFECWLRLLKYNQQQDQYTHTHTHTHNQQQQQQQQKTPTLSEYELIKVTWGGQPKAAPYTHSLCNEWPLIVYPWHSYTLTYTHTHSLTHTCAQRIKVCFKTISNGNTYQEVPNWNSRVFMYFQLDYYHTNMATDQQTTTSSNNNSIRL